MLITCMKIKIAFANSFDHCQLQIELLIRVGGKIIKNSIRGAVLTFIQFLFPGGVQKEINQISRECYNTHAIHTLEGGVDFHENFNQYIKVTTLGRVHI